MERTSCPFLGLKEDPATALDFPSEGNFCHHARPVKAISRVYQEGFCLTADHVSCPIFQAAQTQPTALVAEAFPRTPGRPFTLTRRTMAVIGMPMLLAGAVAISLFWNTLAAPFGLADASIPRTGGGLATPASWSLVMTSTDRPENTAEPTPTDTALVTACPLPAGWIPYTVNPTDSLYRLSVIYGVSVDQLQSANCMGDKTVIFPGQDIYIPDLPTDTPTATSTPVPPLPTDTPIPVSQNNAQSQPVASHPQKPPSPPPTNTPVPPVQNPNPRPTTPPPDPGDHGNNNGGNLGGNGGNGGRSVGNGGSRGHHGRGGNGNGRGGNGNGRGR